VTSPLGEQHPSWKRSRPFDTRRSAVNTTLDMRDSNPLLFMTSGSICTDEELIASTSIHFICDTSVAGVGKPTVISQLPPADEDACSFFLEWRTPVACPTTESAGFYGYFAFSLASFVALLMLYLVCGTLYNRFVLRLSGFDQIPQFSLTSLKYHASAAFENLRDVFESFYHGSRGTGLGLSGSRTDANRRGMNPLSHQWMHGSANLGNSDVNDTSPTSGRRRFDLEQRGVAGTREEREPIIRSDTDQGVEIDTDEGAEDSLSTPTVASVRKGMDPNGVIRL